MGSFWDYCVDRFVEKDHRKIWQTFADHFYLFRGTPSRIWFEHALHEVLGIELPFNPENADVIYDEINEKPIMLWIFDPQKQKRSFQFQILLLGFTETISQFIRFDFSFC